MKEQIINDIDRLSLHDSHIEKIKRTKNKLILTIDWAKLENHAEKNIEEGIILGKCELIFDGYKDEKLKLDFTGTPWKNIKAKEIKFDIKLFDQWLILENKPIAKNQYCLSGLIDYEEKCGWLDWSFSFLEFKFSWDNSVTWKDWRNGKRIEEK